MCVASGGCIVGVTGAQPRRGLEKLKEQVSPVAFQAVERLPLRHRSSKNFRLDIFNRSLHSPGQTISTQRNQLA
jgi:hypothetical protein